MIKEFVFHEFNENLRILMQHIDAMNKIINALISQLDSQAYLNNEKRIIQYLPYKSQAKEYLEMTRLKIKRNLIKAQEQLTLAESKLRTLEDQINKNRV